MGMKFEIEEALHAHATWRKRFRDYLNGNASFDVMAVGDSHQCQFGNWLDKEGYRLMPPNRQDEIRSAHDEFHRIAAEIVQKIKEKRFADVREDISSEGSLNRASRRLSDVLLKARLHEPTAMGVSRPTGSAPVLDGREAPPEPSPTATPTPDKTPE